MRHLARRIIHVQSTNNRPRHSITNPGMLIGAPLPARKVSWPCSGASTDGPGPGPLARNGARRLACSSTQPMAPKFSRLKPPHRLGRDLLVARADWRSDGRSFKSLVVGLRGWAMWSRKDRKFWLGLVNEGPGGPSHSAGHMQSAHSCAAACGMAMLPDLFPSGRARCPLPALETHAKDGLRHEQGRGSWKREHS